MDGRRGRGGRAYPVPHTPRRNPLANRSLQNVWNGNGNGNVTPIEASVSMRKRVKLAEGFLAAGNLTETECEEEYICLSGTHGVANNGEIRTQLTNIQQAVDTLPPLRVEVDAIREDGAALRVEVDAIRVAQDALRVDGAALRVEVDAIRVAQDALRVDGAALRVEVDAIHQIVNTLPAIRLEVGAVQESINEFRRNMIAFQTNALEQQNRVRETHGIQQVLEILHRAYPPGENPPGGNLPGENPPGRNPQGGENPAGGNPPGGNPPGGNPPGGNPPGGNPPGGNP
jgi:FtsZ-binding cell division protein ZapB